MPNNWVYGARSVDFCGDLVNEQIVAAHRYRNRICELELAKRERHYELLRQLAPEFVAFEKAVRECEGLLAEARQKIQSERVKQRRKTPTGVDHWTTQAADCRACLKTLRAELKAAKHAAYEDPAVQDAIKANTARHRQELADAKKNSRLYWGTEAIVTQACRSFGSGAPPRFKRFDGSGQLAVQLQGGLATSDALQSGTLIYFDPDSRRSNGKLVDCYFRVGSDENSRPIFAKLAVVMHRPLPPDGRIKWAYLERRKIANRDKWSVRLTIDMPEPEPRDTTTWVAIHCGWTLQPNGLRIAVWRGSDGQSGSVVLDFDHLNDYAKLDKLRSDRDSGFNEVMAHLIDFCRDRKLPEWLDEVRPHLSKWKSPARLAGLINKWRDQRFFWDEQVFSQLESWRKPDKHMWQHERRLTLRIIRRRTDRYRNVAKQLSDRYGVLYYSQLDAKLLTENSLPEDLERDPTKVHRQAKQAAVSDFVRLTREKFPLHAIETSTLDLTVQCPDCGERGTVKSRMVTCGNCKRALDVDLAALANTVARGQERQKSGALLELAKEAENKQVLAREKLAKMHEARRQKANRSQNQP